MNALYEPVVKGLQKFIPHFKPAVSAFSVLSHLSKLNATTESAHLVLGRLTERPTAASLLSKQLERPLIDDPISTGALAVAITASMASRERYADLTGKLWHVYTALEEHLDKSESPVVRLVWDTHGAQLRRADLIATDLKEVGAWPPAPPTFETTCYLKCLRDAAQSDGLLGHAYFRYAGGLLAEAAEWWRLEAPRAGG